MRIRFVLLPLAVTLLAALGAAAAPVGKPQQLSSPDQTPQGLEKTDWQSIRAAHTAWQHSFQPVEKGWQARNPGQQWTTQFDGRGFTARAKDADWQWGLELRSYGFGDNQQTVGGKPEVKAEGQRLSYQWDANVQEWFINDQRGLEHGFNVAQRPAGAEPGAELDFVLGTRGSLSVSLAADAKTVYFRDAAGAPVVTYAGLKVWDADGVVLPSRFVAGPGGSVILRVDESAARYPITIDPIAQQAYVKAGNTPGAPGLGDGFGYSVAVSGDTVVVGAPFEDSSTTGVNSTSDEGSTNAGAVYVFVRSGTTWSQQAYLKASNTGAYDRFGYSVAVSGETVVVGAYGEDSSTTGVNSTPDQSAPISGAAYVYVRSGTVWSQQAYLKASNTGNFDFFGRSVAVSGDTVVVGAYCEDSSTKGVNSTPNNGAADSGAAYVFERSGTTWSQSAYLKASNTGAGDEFGSSVAVSGDTVVVGAAGEDSSTTGVNSTPNNGAADSGAAYVYVRNGSTWSQQAYVKASNAGAGDEFGSSVSVSGDTVVVGAAREDSSTTGVNSTPNNGATDSGAAYVFVRSVSIWSQQVYLKASNAGAGDEFGSSVAVSGDTVVVGAYAEDSSTTGVNSTPNNEATDSGAAYVYVRSGSTWSQQAYVKASNAGAGDYFGKLVAVSGETVVVGADGEDSSTTGVNSTPDNGAADSGAVYVYERNGTMWSQQAYLKASNNGGRTEDYFGRSVAVSGDTVVVGADGEDSSTTGVNSTPNNGAADSGAAYVYVRSGTTWNQQAYLKASNTGPSDRFGTSVAVSGDTVVVGAYGEDSSTTGVNSTPNKEAAFAGAAYVFVRSGTAWSQQAYLKASQVTQFDQFGCSVAVSGDTVVVGAFGEDSSRKGVNTTPNENARDSGAAYVYVRSGTTWNQQAYLKASNTGPSDRFGKSVAVSGDTVVVGAYGEDSSTTGVNSTPNESATDSGAAYVYVRSGSAWSQQAYVKASNAGAGDYFGSSVAVSGYTVVVGAYQEDSSTTGVNSTPNESASDSGAAYVYVRSWTTWSQQAYLKASNTGAGDLFGISVAVSGETVAVGAGGEDSSTTGVNSTPNESATSSGAAYVYVRSWTTWSQQAYLKASNTGAQDRFGQSVAVSGDTVVVGAGGEDSSTTGVNSTPDERAPDSGAAYIFAGLGPIPAPSLTNVSPPSGPASGGSVVTLTGTAFTGATAVTFGGFPVASYTVDSDTQITATILAGDAGSVSVVVTTPVGSSPASSIFTYLGAEMNVTGNSLSIAHGSTAPSAYLHTDFGIVMVDGGIRSHTYTIQNIGNETLSLIGAPRVLVGGSHSSDFVVTIEPDDTVGPDNSSVFEVTFNPSAMGQRSATLSIINNDANEAPYTLYLQGTGDTFTAQQKHNEATTAAGLTGLEAEPTAILYQGGVSNLLKYAFNLDLTAPDRRTLVPGSGTAGLPVITLPSPGVMRVEYVRRIGSGLVYTPRKRTALDAGVWQPLTAPPQLTPIDANWERIHHDESFNPVTTPEMFGSVEVTLP